MTRKVFCLILTLVLAAQLSLGQESEGKKGDSQEQSYVVKVDVPLTVLDLVFTNKRGDILGITFDNEEVAKNALEVKEEGVLQTIEFFKPSEAPLTTVLLVESTPRVGYIRYQNLVAALIFLRELRKNDWVALVSYDMKPHLEVDFTHDKDEIYQALVRMQVGGFNEANMFDAVIDTLDRLEEAEGKMKTSIVIVGTGLDTFSKHNWDYLSKVVRERRTTIFCINTSWILELYLDRLESRGYQIGPQRLAMLQARNQASDLAKATGGASYVPRFEGQLSDIYKTIGAYLRKQHTIGYYPTNRNFDGKKRKVAVRLKPEFEERIKQRSDVNGDGKIDKKDQKEKISIRHRTEIIYREK